MSKCWLKQAKLKKGEYGTKIRCVILIFNSLKLITQAHSSYYFNQSDISLQTSLLNRSRKDGHRIKSDTYKTIVGVFLVGTKSDALIASLMYQNSDSQEAIAHSGPLDHIPPVKLTFIYFSMDHEINSGVGWSHSSGERCSGPPAFALQPLFSEY